MVMKYINVTKKRFLILISVLLLCLTPAIAADQQPVVDAQVTFEVA
jgi:hypothetical protein